MIAFASLDFLIEEMLMWTPLETGARAIWLLSLQDIDGPGEVCDAYVPGEQRVLAF